MDTNNRNIIYIVGNVVIVMIAVWWATVLFKFAENTFEYFRMIFVAAAQGALLAVGWRYFIVKPQEVEEKKLVCTEPVSAVLVGYRPASVLGEISSASPEKSSRYAIYVFEWDGNEMTVISDLVYRGSPVKNIPAEIMVNPYNPNEIFEPQVERSLLAHYRFLGTMFIFWGFASFFFFFGG